MFPLVCRSSTCTTLLTSTFPSNRVVDITTFTGRLREMWYGLGSLWRRNPAVYQNLMSNLIPNPSLTLVS